MSKIRSALEAARRIGDKAVVAVNSSSGLCCPDLVLQALGERYREEGHPRQLTMIHPIAAGDMFGTKGVDHLAQDGLIDTIIGGSYPSGPSSAEPPLIWKMLGENKISAYNVPSGIVFDILREAAGKRPGVLTKVGLDTFVDPALDGCAMNDRARSRPIVRRVQFEGDEWLYFPAIAPDVAIIRASTADTRSAPHSRGSACSLASPWYIGPRFAQYSATPCAAFRSMVANGPMKHQRRHSPSAIAAKTSVTAGSGCQSTCTASTPSWAA